MISSARPSPPKPLTRALRLVIVDDEPDAVLMLGTLLEHEGHDVRATYSGSNVVRLVHEFDPDVVLLDIGMPDMSGYEVARRIRERFGEKRPTLIALTAWKQSADVLLAKMAGFDHHVGKPYDPDALLDLLTGIGLAKG